jgi:hypothetical protein
MAVSETRVTRGRLLKRAGVGAAAFGAGSMLTASTAGASLPASTVCIGLGGCGVAATFPICPGGSGCCHCFTNTEGCCVCCEDVFCSGIPQCTSSSQCAPGWACIANTGCGAGVCAPHCGAVTHHNACGPAAPQQLVGTKTAAGKGR